MWKVYVGNLSPRTREMDLANEFRSYGLVRSVWIARNPPGYAFVEFDSRQEAYDAIAALDGMHGWRVEMARRVSGGKSRGPPTRDGRCRDCGSHRHHTRDCRSRASRSSSRRSSSPHSRTLMSRDSPQRRLNSRSRSPLLNNRYNESCSSPRNQEKSFPEKFECSRSPQNAHNGSPSAGSPRGHEDSQAQKSGRSKSPQNDLNSPQTDGQLSPKEPEYSTSSRSGCSRSPDDVQKGFQKDGTEVSEHEHSGALENLNGDNSPSQSA